MPNQFEAPKIVLTRQAEMPKLALGATPLAALGEGLTGVLSTIAKALPEAPVLPAGMLKLPAMGAAAPQLPKMPMVTEFIKSIETGLPAGLPKLGQAIIPGAGAKEEVAPAPKKAPELVFE